MNTASVTPKKPLCKAIIVVDKSNTKTLKSRNADYTHAYIMLKQSLLAYLRSKLNDHDLAEDIVHEAFVRAIDTHESFPIKDLNAWLRRVVHNTLVDHYRYKAKYDYQHTGDFYSESANEDESEHVSEEVHHIFAQFVRPFVDTLAPKYSQTIVLKDYEGKTIRAIAAELNISQSAVKSRLARARKQLKTQLQKCCEIELESGFVSDFRPKNDC